MRHHARERRASALPSTQPTDVHSRERKPAAAQQSAVIQYADVTVVVSQRANSVSQRLRAVTICKFEELSEHIDAR